MVPRKDVSTVGLVVFIAACAALLCMALISSSNLRAPPVVLLAKQATNAKASKGDFVLNYLRSNKDVEGHHRRMQRLSVAQIQREAGDNADKLSMMFRSARERAVGPDGLNDVGDLADITLLSELGGQNTRDSVTADAVDLRHHVRRDSLSFATRKPVHDMEHEEARIDEGAHYGQIGGEGGDSFHVLQQTVGSQDVDNLGTDTDRDVFKMVAAATAEPSKQDVHLDNLFSIPRAEASALSSSTGDSEAEELSDPNHMEHQAERQEAAKSDKGIWVEPGSNKGYDSYALDSLQTHGSA